DRRNAQYPANVSLLPSEFPGENTGYAGRGAGFPQLHKTTDKGLNGNLHDPPPIRDQDMQFSNNDTGCKCSDITIGGGVVKTTNGGINWELQLGQEYKPSRVFFANSATGWATYTLGVLYKTTNGGSNWFTQYNFTHGISDLFMTSKDTGWITG